MPDPLEMNFAATGENSLQTSAKFTRSPFIAAVLSLFGAGAGQAYNREWNKAIGFAVASLLAGWIFIHFRLMASFRGLLLGCLPLAAFRVYITVDAALQARKRSRAFSEARSAMALSVAAIVIVIGCFVLESSDYLNPLTKFRAFRVPSGSMCPTICVGDRMVSEVQAFRLNGPRRGDVVMFSREGFEGLLVKRVVAVAGDEVSDLAGRLEVNGSLIASTLSSCGTKLPARGPDYQPPPDMQSFRVPPREYFVIGDDLDNSFDSRYFGPIDADEVRGRPLYLYWSATAARIGCPIK